MSDDYARALAVAVEAAYEAGALLRAEFHHPGGPRGHGGHADVDEEAERVIRHKLLAAFPWDYVGEELGPAEGEAVHHRWMVDPNDGTAAFLQGWRGSAVSIAALRDGVPVLGVVYAFAYPDDDGDLIAWAEGCPLTRNGEPMEMDLSDGVLDDRANPPDLVFLSQDADRCTEANAACVWPARYIALPSIAYRLARVAVGDGLGAVSLSGPGAWDYAAGHALLRASRGVLVDESGSAVRYEADGNSSTQWCFGGSPAVVEVLRGRDWRKVLDSGMSPPSCLVRPVRGRVINDAGLLARAQGCLLGQLAGDALGGLVEFQGRRQLTAWFPEGLRDLEDGGTWENLAGQPTDDSELALMLARTLVQCGRYDRGEVLNAYLHWWPHAWDKGTTISAALKPASLATTTEERLRAVEQHALKDRPSNGSLMRVSPLGIFGAGRPAEAAEWARQDSQLTHPHPDCVDACAAYVAAISTAIGQGATPAECHQAALAEARQESVRQALEAAGQVPPNGYDTLGTRGWVMVALQNAFYQLLHAANLEEGVVDSAMRGGDTDTNAAIAGALLGAVHGRRAVPQRWINVLQACRTLEGSGTKNPQPPEFWPVDVLELSEALLYADRNPVETGCSRL